GKPIHFPNTLADGIGISQRQVTNAHFILRVGFGKVYTTNKNQAEKYCAFSHAASISKEADDK
ncbi:MAG: hypothetical protein KDD72_08290, partial [Anaerolineales bacterium]|nr:hypothetical protein [Anaerolineales bacterium]